MAGGRKLKFRLPRITGLALWVPITGLLALGLVTTLVDLAQLPLKEATRANETRQRYVVNATTGEVSLGDSSAELNAEPPTAFDVAAKDEAPAPDAAAAGETPAESAQTEAPTPEPTAQTLGEGMPTLRTEPLVNAAAIEMPAHTKDSLVGAPAPEITETVDGVRIPKRGDKDAKPSTLYAHRFTRKPDQVLIVFVVMNAGFDAQSIGLILGLPSEINVAYSAYSHADSNYSEHLRASGHEVWTILPVMNDRYPSDDPGPMGIIGRMPPEEIIRRTHLVMGAVLGSVGLVLPPDEAVSLHKGTLDPVLGELTARGMLLLATHPTRSIDQLTTNKGLAEIIRRADLVIDSTPDEAQIRSKLAGVLPAAKEKGEYVVLLSARPQSLQILGDWLKETKITEPYALAPLSAIYLPKDAPEVKAPEESGGHGGGEKKKEKPKEVKKKPKVLPQDQYKQPAEGAKEGGHGGGH